MNMNRKKQMKTDAPNTLRQRERKVKRWYFSAAAALLLCVVTTVPAFAAGDPLGVVNNMSDFVFSIIKALGVILLGFGIVQIGMSLKSHDASQRATGFMTFFGGLMIAFAKEILDLIMG